MNIWPSFSRQRAADWLLDSPERTELSDRLVKLADDLEQAAKEVVKAAEELRAEVRQ